ncbi:MAG: flagellar basal body L-ring protein FlgH [Myxococcales bacterium]|nr:flagellar basal body L-ring protein FlgH [Myxococcales bacterium]
MLVVLALGCAVGPMGLLAAPPPPLPEPDEYVDEPEPGASLWASAGSRAALGNNNARAVGDVVTIKIDESVATQLGADTNTARDTKSNFAIEALLGLDTSLLRDNPNMGGSIGLGGSSGTSLAGSGRTSRDGSMQTTLSCTVKAVYPNGTILLEGRKRVGVNNETQFVTFRGVARPRDISLANTIDSYRLADVQVEVTGGGVLANQQGQGWATSIANVLWPF